MTDLLGELRRASGLSLGQVAVRSGFSVSYISEVISGKKTPSPDSAMKIATALGASRERALRAYNHAESHAELKRYVRTKPRLQNIKIGNGSHAFISYVREDFQKIDKLHHILENAGIPVWRDTADLWPGENWRAKIRSAITDNALVFIACFSNKSLARKSSFQNEELVLAIEQLRLRQPDEPWLIPVRLDDCILPELDIGGGRTLASIQHADLFGRRFAKEAGKVTSAAIRILGQANKSS